MATTYSPTRERVARAERRDGQVAPAAFSSWRTATSRRVVLADDLRLELAVVGELDLHDVGAVDDVRVGHDVTLRVDEEARAERLLLHDLVAVALAAVGTAVPVRALVEEREELAEVGEAELAARDRAPRARS